MKKPFDKLRARPILISGIQPSGKLHVGNYLGALKNFVELQNSGKFECYFFIADYHALTENPKPNELRERTKDLQIDFLAAGLDPKKSTLFIQSQSPLVQQLKLFLSPLVPVSELLRMTAFKEKVLQALKPEDREKITKEKFDEIAEGANYGLVEYPVLMAADIMLYDAEFVPVGDDQLQHLELARTLVRKFNNKYGKTFIEPRPLLTKAPRVMSLSDLDKKMSKSSPEGCLFLDDAPEIIKKKIARAVTDSGSEVKFNDVKKPGIANLMRIYQGITDKAFADIESEFRGRNYSQFKETVAEVLIKELEPFRIKKSGLMKNHKKVEAAFTAGGKLARKRADQKMKLVKKAIGIL